MYFAVGCSSAEFECNNGNCISQLLVCNDVNSCGDNSDETNCGGFGQYISTYIGSGTIGYEVNKEVMR